ncbi:MAG: hypothetical protein ACRD9Y_03970 [Blastocatellia bacterium]
MNRSVTTERLDDEAFRRLDSLRYVARRVFIHILTTNARHLRDAACARELAYFSALLQNGELILRV